ncbi:MAG TPA: IS1 family transposase [Microvirga sp.]|jgi:IS1 family transposase|nr:IS1 family transposase [Microvirga sp.]
MNKLSAADRARIIHLLCEGNSIRAVTRLTGASKNTVIKLLTDVGRVCHAYQDEVLRNLSCQRVQVDEIWSFTYAKQKNVPTAKAAPSDAGDTWTWTAICADTKLIISWLVGGRDSEYASMFIADLKDRLANRVQLTSDGHKAYLGAVEDAFGADVDFAQLVKLYGPAPDAFKGRYSPAECTGIIKTRIEGNPDPKHVSTSYAERQNLTMRMHMRRFTRLTNAFSKKIENHAYAVALHTMYYNFVRIHSKLRVTPAMAAGVTERLWEVSDIVALVEASEAAAPKARGPYKKRAA